MSGELEKLKRYQPQILLAEVGVWLHLLGKFSNEFLRRLKAPPLELPDDYLEIISRVDNVKDVLEDHWLQSLLQRNLGELLGLEPVNFPRNLYYFSKFHRRGQSDLDRKLNSLKPRGQRKKLDYKGKKIECPDFLHLLVDAHGRGSGTDKSVQADSIYSQQQPLIYLATAFGYETSIDNARLDEIRDELYESIATTLEQIKNRLTNGENINWAKLLPSFIGRLREAFSITVGDTRRPINDVSLWDQTLATVAFFKPALAKNVLLGSWQNPLQTKYKWRFLRVVLDGLSYWGLANRIGDLRARQELVKNALDAVKELLEITYPLSAEVYRDEIGSLFLVPDEPDELLKLTDENSSTLEELIHREVAAVFDGELRVELQLDDHATRNVFRAGRLLSQPLPPLSAEPHKLQEWWSSTTEQELCSLCSLRPQGFGAQNQRGMKAALERDICCTCMDRLAGQARQWTQELERTIWIDEVGDSNARAALIVGQFDLEDWLNGIYISSMTIPNPSNIDGDEQGHHFRELLVEVEAGLRQNSLLTSPIIISKMLNREVIKDLKSFYKLNKFLVEDEDLAEIVGDIQPHQRLALALVRKPPSFARIRRVWETTKRFSEAVRDESIPQQLEVRQRIELVGTFTPDAGESLQSHQPYELVVSDYRMPVFCKSIEGDQGQFLTIDNLGYAAKRLSLDDVQQILKKSKEYTLELPGGYGMRRRKVGIVTISETRSATQAYRPHIAIVAEPRTFMALVPADQALEIAQKIKTEYEREMGKVRNRLPLHLGVVFFPRKQPLRSVLEAGRNMLDGFAQTTPDAQEHWDVSGICDFNDHLPERFKEDSHFCQGRTVELTRNGRSIRWHVPLAMGDRKTEDKWYPYVFIEADEDDLSERTLKFKGLRPTDEDGQTEECWLIHASELKAGDHVYFTPSLFDFEWLDTNARRFDVSYAEGKRRAPTKRNRPYLLDDLERFKKLWGWLKDGLSTAQIKQLDGLIEAKRSEWKQGTGHKKYDEVFKQFVCNVLKNAKWKHEPEDWHELYHATLTGELHDVLELFMTILKEEPDPKGESHDSR